MSKIAVNEITDEVGTGAPAFPNGMSVTGAALTDPEVTGGIYLGGTGSANYLEDYEEGTWTPTLDTSGSVPTGVTYEYRSGNYTKIGNRVIAQFGFKLDAISTTGSGQIKVTGLPFTPRSFGAWQEPAITIKAGFFTNASTIENGLTGYVSGGVPQVFFRTGNTDTSVSSSEIQSTTGIGAVVIYDIA